MRWMRCGHDGLESFGIVEDDRVQPVEGSPFATYRKKGQPIPLAQVAYLPPVIPRVFYAAGMNYANHVDEAAEYFKGALKLPTKPDVGYRASNALTGHNTPIVVPSDSPGPVQYEAELVAVVSRLIDHPLSEDEALSYILGYTIGNDVSERTWQGEDRTLWRSKNTQTFKPMGPWIETEVDLPSMVTEVRINGEARSRFATNNMIHGVALYVSTMSKYLTIYPGDIIWMGTEAPVHDIHPGDVVDIEIAGIGTLRNPVERQGEDGAGKGASRRG